MNKTKYKPHAPRTLHRPSRGKKRPRTVEREVLPLSVLVPRLGMGMCVCVLSVLTVGGVLLLLAALLLWLLPDPDAWLAGVSVAVLLLSALAGGIMMARTVGGRAVLCGLCGGGAILLLMFLLSYLPVPSAMAMGAGGAVGLRLAVPVFCVLGASLGVNFPGKR